jgi:membrane protease YdiL (CAAX protease family)
MINNSTLGLRKTIAVLFVNRKVDVLIDLILVFSPFVVIGAIGELLGDGTALGALVINLAYALGLIFATVVLKWRRSGWRHIGLAKPESWRKTVLIAIGVVFVMIIANLVVQGLLQILAGSSIAPLDQSSYDSLVGSLPLFLLYILATWTLVAFGEEMLFRAFLTALLVSSLIFGLAHISWGIAGVIQTAIMGLILGLAYFRTKQNLWVTIIAHGLLDTLMFLFIFSGVA